MASPAIQTIVDESTNDSDTDYGSDFSPEEEQIVGRLLSGQVEIEDNPIVSEIEHHEVQHNLRLPRVLGRERQSPLFQAVRDAENFFGQISDSVKHRKHYPDSSSEQTNKESSPDEDSTTDPAPADSTFLDTRSPLERFRTHPKKALSVTDLVSPAWCELQYWYTLTIHGRKKRTPAMKQGSVVHKHLEEQVHKTVPIDTETKEDKWGLRIWNVIQGLRTLRSTGLTRELEIWGTIDGLVVNGVIDELSYICPDEELEESLEKPSKDEPPPDQAIVSDFFKATGGSSPVEATRPKRRSRSNKIYVCDVKTRSVRSLPAEVSFRPTRMQLMLYHSLLVSLATNMVDLSIITSRYNLDASAVFSDKFIDEIGKLNGDTFYDAESTPNGSQDSIGQWSQDSASTLRTYNSLSALWSLMISEFQETLPDGAASLGKILKAEYRSRDNGDILGSKTFAMDQEGLAVYVEDEMKWWKGEREPQGVVIEEAFKCRSCDFAEGCEWRLKKIDEAKEKVRLSRKRKSDV